MAFQDTEWLDSESDDEWLLTESDDESDDEWILTESSDEPAELDVYEALRPALNASWRECSPEQIEALLESVTRGMTIAEAENFWKSVANIGRQIAPVAGQVLGVAAPLIGGAIGGPAGAAIGNVAGRFAGQALGSLGAPAAARPPAGAPQVPVARPMPTPTPTPIPIPTTPPTAAPMPGGSSATAQLLSFLQNPQLLQSILGQLLGSAGQSTQQVGTAGASAPFGAFMNALGVLANQAGGEAASEGEASDYLYDSEGHLLGDPSSPEERAAALLEQLRSGPAY